MKFKACLFFTLVLFYQNCLVGSDTPFSRKGGSASSTTLRGNGDIYDGKVYDSLETCEDERPAKRIVKASGSTDFVKVRDRCRNESETVAVHAPADEAGMDFITHESDILIETKSPLLGGLYCTGFTEVCAGSTIPRSVVEIVLTGDPKTGRLKFVWRIDNCRVGPVVFDYFQTKRNVEEISPGIFSDEPSRPLDFVTTLNTVSEPPTVSAEWNPLIEIFRPLTSSYTLDTCTPLPESAD